MESTEHKIYFEDATVGMKKLKDSSVDLIVTSPPYPMIGMWDEEFREQIGFTKVEANSGLIYDCMHRILEGVWKESYRVLKNGGFCIINIGDATRTIDDRFRLWSNHSTIIEQCTAIGFTPLTSIIWSKPTNSPNKFMGSGMLPCGAYVTLEHEYILIFRKGGKREYKTDADKELRRKSAFFWEERNEWFSDIWKINGTRQSLTGDESRTRSAAYPFEIPYRLISMYSQIGDTVLDPFTGLGTTNQAAIALGRNSIGYEIDKSFREPIMRLLESTDGENIKKQRVKRHNQWVSDEISKERNFKYRNENYGFPVMTKQETEIEIPLLKSVGLKVPLGRSNIEDNDNELVYNCIYG